MKLFEEYKLYEDMWDDTDHKEVVAESATDTSWDNQVAQANIFLDAIIKATGNENYDDGDGYWSGEEEWCNRYMYYANSVANLAQVEELCEKLSTDSCNFYVFEDDEEEDPVSEIGYTLTKGAVTESGCKGAECKKEFKEDSSLAGHRVVLADYDTDDFDINVEFGMQDPEENEVVDYEYLLKPGQTAGDLVVWLSRDCGYTSIYVHDERPATPEDIKRLASDTFPVTDTGDEWQDYGEIVEAVDLKSKKMSTTEAPAARYEILYSDRHTEIVDEKTMSQLVDELESFTRDDVLQIHRIYSNGKLGKTIWTEEEGLF